MFDAASASCRAIRTWTAEIALSGRVARRRLRARVLAGLQAPDALRLEAVAPFGKPIFILVARGNRATLLLPREARVLDGAAPAAILEALAGIAIRPEELRAIATGCVSSDPRPVSARRYGDEWAAVDLKDGWTVYLRQARPVAAARGSLVLEYRAWQGGWPAEIQLRSAPPGGSAADLILALSQVETNVALAAEAFTIEIPNGTAPLTLEELRHAGPLGTR